MKKKFLLFSVLAVFTLILTGCATTTNNQTTTGTLISPTTGEAYESCTLTYAAWDLGSADSETPNMDRYMLEAFEQAYPGITVNIIERPKEPGTENDQNWDEFLAARASVGTLPDVYQPDDIPLCITNEWCLDLSQYVASDSEYQAMSSDITSAATYNGHVMALPQSIFYMGFLVNETLYDEANEDAPTTATTLDALLEATKSAANHTSTTGKGVVGLQGIEHILHWYPAQLNTSYGWWTYDGTKFNLDSDEFVQAVNLYRTLATDTSYVLEALQTAASQEGSTIVLEDIFGTTDYVNDEKILCKFVYSYDFGSYQTKIDNGDLQDDYAFIGTPVVNGVKRVPIVLDFLCVSSTTEHPYEAYLLSKWMGYGDDGYAERIALGEQYSDQGMDLVNYPPMTGNSDLLDDFFDIYTAFSDLRDIINAGNYIVEPPKYLPGYNAARYSGTYDAESTMYQEMIKIMTGEVNIADVKTELNTRANSLMNEAKAKMEASLNKLG
ncbi:MAG: extracellular solute-binding protein [Bacillales bacterium]|nr:extracellular solute-binding protein [Bacillales bacterium]